MSTFCTESVGTCAGDVSVNGNDTTCGTLDSKLQCPSCGSMKNLTQTMGQKVIAVVIAADRDFRSQFNSAGVKLEPKGRSFKVCSKCGAIAVAAIAAALLLFPMCAAFKSATSSSKAALVLPNKIVCGGTLLVTWDL